MEAMQCAKNFKSMIEWEHNSEVLRNKLKDEDIKVSSFKSHAKAHDLFMISILILFNKKLNLPLDGCIETIIEQINRGNEYPTTRNKAWIHILIELKFSKNDILENEFKNFIKDVLIENIVDPAKDSPNDDEVPREEGVESIIIDNNNIVRKTNDEENTNDDSLSESQKGKQDIEKLNETKPRKSKLGLTRRPSNTRQRSNSKSNVENKNEVNKNVETIEKLQQKEKLTIFERNELWLARKAVKMEQNAKTLEEEVGTGLRRISISRNRNSFSTTQRKSSIRRKSVNTRRNSTGNEFKETKHTKENFEESKEDEEDEDLKEIIETGGICSVLSSLDETLLELSRIVGNNEQCDDDDDFGEELNEQDINDNGMPPMPREGFFTRINNDNHRGIYRVLDPHKYSDINISSIYTKRDRNSGLGSAIALTVGRTMNTVPIREKVIEVIFDVTKVCEHDAYVWWYKNKHRFNEA